MNSLRFCVVLIHTEELSIQHSAFIQHSTHGHLVAVALFSIAMTGMWSATTQPQKPNNEKRNTRAVLLFSFKENAPYRIKQSQGLFHLACDRRRNWRRLGAGETAAGLGRILNSSSVHSPTHRRIHFRFIHSHPFSASPSMPHPFSPMRHVQAPPRHVRAPRRDCVAWR